MRVAICAQGPTLDSAADERFGRCRYFVLADTDTGEVTALSNPAAEAESGAGTNAVQLLVSNGVTAVCAKSVGPHALSMFAASGIKVYRFESGSVAEVLEDFKRGNLDRMWSGDLSWKWEELA